jgi:hypothetical protein
MGGRPMNASDTLKKTIEALNLSEACILKAEEVLKLSLPEDNISRFRKEWLNDVISLYGKDIFESILKDPDGDFLKWLTDKLTNPYMPSHRAIRYIGQQYGFQISSLFINVRWYQEVAWAKRMRMSSNDITSCLAETWLKITKRDPDRMIKGILAIYSQDGILDPQYRDSALHFLAPEEIANSAEPPWRPLWLRFAEKEFKNFVVATTSARRKQLADKIRNTQMLERDDKEFKVKVEKYKKHRLSLRISIISKALQSGLSSDDLLEAETYFLSGLENGKIAFPKANISITQMFSISLPKWACIAPVPSSEESLRRIHVIQEIEPRWVKTLPFDIQTLGGTKTDLLFKWHDGITSQPATRLPPLDPTLDFCMFIVENTLVSLPSGSS